MVARNFPKPEERTIYHKFRAINATMEVELFNQVREMAIAEDRSLSNMITTLVKRGVKASHVSE